MLPVKCVVVIMELKFLCFEIIFQFLLIVAYFIVALGLFRFLLFTEERIVEISYCLPILPWCHLNLWLWLGWTTSIIVKANLRMLNMLVTYVIIVFCGHAFHLLLINLFSLFFSHWNNLNIFVFLKILKENRQESVPNFVPHFINRP